MTKRFTPHAVLVTEHTTPIRGQISIAAAIGIENILVVPLDTRQPAATFMRQVLGKLPEHVVAFGRVLGFWLVYRDDWSVRYDRDGNPCEIRETAVECGCGTIATIH
jgi:hypothetical protein